MMRTIILLFFLFKVSFLFAQKLKDDQINECSGLVVSSKNEDRIWVHNDSGDKGRIFLINKSGETLAIYNFKAKVVDCEDIAMSNPKNRKPQIYVGDIGDNKAERDFISIYKFDEPNYLKGQNRPSVPKVEQLKLKYPDGPRDAECLMIDPISQKIYIISKREDSVGVYSVPLKIEAGSVHTLTKEGTLSFPGMKKINWITAGDISGDGRSILIKSYGNVFYWKRQLGETMMQCLKRSPKILPYKPEPQGEATGFTHDGKSYYTISEGKGAEIFKEQIK